MAQFTVAASMMIDLAQQLARDGIPSGTLCDRAGVDPALLSRAHDRVSAADADRIWSAGAALSGDALLGLHLAGRYREGALNILGYVLLNCKDAAAALDCLRRYAALLNDGLVVRVQTSITQCVVVLEPVADSRNPLLADGRHVFETMAAGIVLTLRRLTGKAFVPRVVAFRHASAGDIAEYHRVFGTAVRFGAKDTQLTFAREELSAPILSADSTLLPILEAQAKVRLDALTRDGDTSRRVLREIAARLTGTAPSVNSVARALAMSARALQRALQEEGNSFQGLLDEARREVAERQLRAPDATASEVALLLGYSETSAFTRAFRRWTGMTPSAWASKPANA
jgi:AraC-like DNA-binding protein